jgi:hypothetical protein
VPLEDVFRKIYDKYGENPLPVESKSDADALGDFMGEVLPEYDRDRVYPSDMKKLVIWYTILVNHLPEFFQAQSGGGNAGEETPTETGAKAEAEPAKETPGNDAKG